MVTIGLVLIVDSRMKPWVVVSGVFRAFGLFLVFDTTCARTRRYARAGKNGGEEGPLGLRWMMVSCDGPDEDTTQVAFRLCGLVIPPFTRPLKVRKACCRYP